MRSLISQVFAPSNIAMPTMPKDMRRREYVTKANAAGRLEIIGVQLVANYARLESRGHGGQTPHKVTGVSKIRRAARKSRNRK
jgi:hypothetical protein